MTRLSLTSAGHLRILTAKMPSPLLIKQNCQDSRESIEAKIAGDILEGEPAEESIEDDRDI